MSRIRRALPRARRTIPQALHAVAIFASFGILGLAAGWLIRRRRWSGWTVHACDGVVWVVFAALVAGSAARVFEDAHGVAQCEPPPEIHDYAWDQGRQVAVEVTPFENAMTWPVSGLLIAYADVSGANLCYFPVQEFYLARFGHWPLPRRAIFVGNVFLARELDVYDIDGGLRLSSHEVRHRKQWAFGTLVGGPFAFPTAYTIDDFFFPGSLNHFERAAGLEGAGYDEESSPRLRVTEVVLFGLVAAAVGVAAVKLRTRHERK